MPFQVQKVTSKMAIMVVMTRTFSGWNQRLSNYHSSFCVHGTHLHMWLLDVRVWVCVWGVWGGCVYFYGVCVCVAIGVCM